MHFTNVRSIHKNLVNTKDAMSNGPNNRIFSIRYSTGQTLPIASINQQQVLSHPSPTIDPSKKILWGPPFWFFFHTLAEKVKPDMFIQHRTAIINIIQEVCRNLPCPTCAAHAIEYMNNININSIRTKEDFKLMLFEFHNSVNARKKTPLFSYADLEQKYKRAVFINIVNHFMHFYKMEHHVVRMIADSMYRQRSAKNILDWLHSNQYIFDK
jgi:hypothetical protein